MIYATKLVVFWEFISSLSENFLTIFLLTTMTMTMTISITMMSVLIIITNIYCVEKGVDNSVDKFVNIHRVLFFHTNSVEKDYFIPIFYKSFQRF